MKTKLDETVEMLRDISQDEDFDVLIPMSNQDFHGAVHSILEVSTGNVFHSQGETYSEETGLIIAIDRNMNFEELKPGEYEILEVLSWNEETDDLEIVPYKE